MKKVILKITILIIFGFIFINADKRKDIFNLKNFEKTIGKINDTLYASKFEVSNFQYRMFLKDLRQKTETEKYNIAIIDSAKWREMLPDDTTLFKYYHVSEKLHDHPVVNVSFEAALLFCEWLTEKYNVYPKRKFKKILFRLPTESEWKEAARGTSVSSMFPWGGPSMRNSKTGFYMANFTDISQYQIYKDKETSEFKIKGLPLYLQLSNVLPTAPVFLYPPNEYGLHNMSGNVAEMISEKGKTKGGSWASTGYYLQIDVEGENDGISEPSPMIGFRYFMEIIEK